MDNLNQSLAEHGAWLKGKKADLSSADLRYADLEGADLEGVTGIPTTARAQFDPKASLARDAVNGRPNGFRPETANA